MIGLEVLEIRFWTHIVIIIEVSIINGLYRIIWAPL